MNPKGDISNDTNLHTYDFLAQYTNSFGDAHTWVAGFNYRLNTASNELMDKFAREHRLGIYVEDTLSILETISVAAGIRYDLHTFINPTISPRAPLLWNPFSDHTFRFGISIGYRPPTLLTNHLDVRTQINLPLPSSTMTLVAVGSENLDPEQIISYELKYQGWFWQHRLRVRTAAFYNHISDLVEFVQTGPAPQDLVSAINNGEADIFGGELGIEYWATPWLSGFVNGAFQEIGQTIRGITERAGPRFKINGGIRVQNEMGWSGEALVHLSVLQLILSLRPLRP